MITKAEVENHFAGNYEPFYSQYLGALKTGSGDEKKAQCHFHDDKNPSLSFNVKTGLFQCFGCGASGSIFDYYALEHGLDARRDLNEIIEAIAGKFGIVRNGDQQKEKPKVVCRYDYHDETGQLAYQIERLEPKSFRIRRPDRKGGWLYNGQGVTITPYHLPEILKADEVLIVEGEKDADALITLGLTATTNPFGAGKWPDHFGQFFKGKNVILIPDNDEPGRDHMKKVMVNLRGAAASIKWLDLPGLAEKGDVSDFISQFQSKEEASERLSILLESAATIQGAASKSTNKFHFLSAAELCRERKKADWLIKPYFNRDTLGTIFGEAGSGKSFLATDFGLCVASNHQWHGFQINQTGTVFYIAGEGFGGFNRRIKAWADQHGCELAKIPFFVSDRPAQILEPASVKEIQQAIDELSEKHGKPVLIIIDTLNRNFGPGDENSTGDMTRFISGLDDIRARYQCAILTVHHSGLTATDRARGASALRAALDWEYRLTKNADGTRTLTCTKSKDYGEPEPLNFEMDTVELDWLDDDGEPLTSCIMRRVDVSEIDETISLRGTKRIAYDCLLKLGGAGIDVDEWRLACYTAGISPTSNTEAKRKAFKRAVSELQDRGIVSARNDLWWARKADTGQMNDYSDLQNSY